jgi:hypothetical protein
MRIYWGLKSVPELAALDKDERSRIHPVCVAQSKREHKSLSNRSSKTELGMVAWQINIHALRPYYAYYVAHAR